MPPTPGSVPPHQSQYNGENATGGGAGHHYSYPDPGTPHPSSTPSATGSGGSVTDMNRSSVGSHSSFHPLCHPVSPHSPPAAAATSEATGGGSGGSGGGGGGGNTNCASRLYLPNACPNRSSSHLNVHTPNPHGSGGSSMWQHMTSIGSAATLSLPQFSSPHTPHMMKQESGVHPKDNSLPPVIDVSPHYNPEDIKFKLSQNVLQSYSGFPPQLYPPHMTGDFVGNGIPFEMLPGLPSRCRTISRSNSGMPFFVFFIILYHIRLELYPLQR